MGVSDRKEREKEEMRSKILDAAKALFLEKGFEKTSIRNIADKIEYSPGTIYLYFKDKNELFYELHILAFQQLMIALKPKGTATSAFEGLVDMGRDYIHFGVNNPELYELMFLMEAPIDALTCKDEIWDDGMKAFDLLKQLVIVCKQEGYFPTADADTASLNVWSFVHGLVTLKVRQRLSMFNLAEEEMMAYMLNAFQLFIEQIKCTKN